jgi:hypothetical protein
VAGYSGTPLAKKLGIKPDSTVAFVGETPPSALEVGPTDGVAPFDVVLAFVRHRDMLATSLQAWSALISPAGGLWICWPKKTARRLPAYADADMTEDDVREFGLPMNLVDNKLCAVDNEWSSLRLVWRVEHRGAVAARQRS